MQVMFKLFIATMLLASCSSVFTHGAAAFQVYSTYSNYHTGLGITIQEVRSEDGKKLAHGGTLGPSSSPFLGATLGSIDGSRSLPESITVIWEEYPLELQTRMPTPEEMAAIQRKSVTLKVRERIPATVIEELRHSPREKDSRLPINALWLYLIWTKDKVLFHWEAKQGCCTVLSEGGDAVP